MTESQKESRTWPMPIRSQPPPIGALVTKVIIPTPPTVEVAAERVSVEFAQKTEGLECVDWYLCKKSVKAG